MSTNKSKVFNSWHEYVDAIANYFTITNLGQSPDEVSRWEDLCEEETADAVQEEFRAWKRVAGKIADYAQDKELNMTLELAEEVWNSKYVPGLLDMYAGKKLEKKARVAAPAVEPTEHLAFIEGVKEYCLANYNKKGWGCDIVIECMTDAEIAEVIKGTKTLMGAKRRILAHVAPAADKREEQMAMAAAEAVQ